ncbi:MAG: hypothetical protein CSA42_00040 [Gammaproteobacteria bacterium]|nr:MAG: hypothetical protein CSA42_00040 [Gammaproteobacteria bacterium]
MYSLIKLPLFTSITKFFTPARIDKIMLICVMGYALFKLADRATGDVFLGFLLIGTLVIIAKEKSYFLRDKIFLLFLFALVTQVASWLYGRFVSPYEVTKLSITPLGNLFYFICVAYWLKARPKYILLTLLSFSIGVVLTCITHSQQPILEFISGLKGVRVDFDITNANHTAALSGVATMLCIFLGFTILKNKFFFNTSIKRWGLLFIILGLFVINLLITYMTQSRATWLALFISIIFSIFFIAQSMTTGLKHRISVLLTLLTFTALIIFSALQVKTVHNRVFTEQSTIQKITTLTTNPDIKKLPNSSIGLRIKFWVSALPWMKEYPILGLGDKFARKFVIRQSPHLSDDLKKAYGHLHQGFLEVLAGYGLLGLIVVLGIFFYIIRTAFSLTSPHKKYIIWGAITFTIYYFTINLFESFFFFKSGELIHNIMLGCLYSFYLTQSIESQKIQTNK